MATPDELVPWITDRLTALGLEWPGLPERPHTAVVGIDGLEPSKDAVRWSAAICTDLHHVAALGLYLMPGDDAEFPSEGADAP